MIEIRRVRTREAELGVCPSWLEEQRKSLGWDGGSV